MHVQNRLEKNFAEVGRVIELSIFTCAIYDFDEKLIFFSTADKTLNASQSLISVLIYDEKSEADNQNDVFANSEIIDAKFIQNLELCSGIKLLSALVR